MCGRLLTDTEQVRFLPATPIQGSYNWQYTCLIGVLWGFDSLTLDQFHRRVANGEAPVLHAVIWGFESLRADQDVAAQGPWG